MIQVARDRLIDVERHTVKVETQSVPTLTREESEMNTGRYEGRERERDRERAIEEGGGGVERGQRSVNVSRIGTWPAPCLYDHGEKAQY